MAELCAGGRRNGTRLVVGAATLVPVRALLRGAAILLRRGRRLAGFLYESAVPPPIVRAAPMRAAGRRPRSGAKTTGSFGAHSSLYGLTTCAEAVTKVVWYLPLAYPGAPLIS